MIAQKTLLFLLLVNIDNKNANFVFTPTTERHVLYLSFNVNNIAIYSVNNFDIHGVNNTDIFKFVLWFMSAYEDFIKYMPNIDICMA